MKDKKWTERVKVVRDNLKDSEVVTEDGEVVRLHKKAIDELAMEIVNYAEKINGTDDDTIAEDNKREIIKKKNEQNEFQLFVKDNFGGFYFNFYNRLIDVIEPQYLTRFLYLCTYLDYEGRLVQKIGVKNIPLKERELSFILKLSPRETLNTKRELIENNLISIEDDVILVNPRYCRRGDIVKNKKVEKVRMFNSGIKELYELSSNSEHKKLALLFQLLPHINLRWNVVCKNPDEELFECIKPYSVKELMQVLNQSNVTRFKKNLLDLTVCDEAVAFINTNKYGELLTINPKVYYKGVDINELNYLMGLFKINKDQ